MQHLVDSVGSANHRLDILDGEALPVHLELDGLNWVCNFHQEVRPVPFAANAYPENLI